MIRRLCNAREKSKRRPSPPKYIWASTPILPLVRLKPLLSGIATSPSRRIWEHSRGRHVHRFNNSGIRPRRKREAKMDLSVELGKISLKHPLICASSEFTMTAAGIKAALDAGAAAVVAKSVNESPQAARQLDTADYVLLDQNWNVVSWKSKNLDPVSLFCRSGLAKTPLHEWLKLLAELDDYARTKNAYVV